MNRFKRNHPKVHAALRYLLYTIGGCMIMALSLADSPQAVALAMAVVLMLAIPVVIILFLQVTYYTYGWFKYGNPYHDETRPYVYQTVIKNEVKARAWCHICKENTGCRVRRNPVTGLVVHVLNGGGRPVKM